MSELDDVIRPGVDDSMNQAFRDGAVLRIRLDEEGEIFGMPYIQLGTSRFYFYAKYKPTVKNGLTGYELVYDGWEKSVAHLGIKIKPEG